MHEPDVNGMHEPDVKFLTIDGFRTKVEMDPFAEKDGRRHAYLTSFVDGPDGIRPMPPGGSSATHNDDNGGWSDSQDGGWPQEAPMLPGGASNVLTGPDALQIGLLCSSKK